MCRRMTAAVLLGMAAVWLAAPGVAEITSIAGAVGIEVTEYYDGVSRDVERVSDSYPDTATVLPIQVAAFLFNSEASGGVLGEEAGASVGAQFADPRTVTSPNPEEFAINLALHSISEQISYQAQATASETRGVRYSAAELGLLLAHNQAATVTGRLFLDGAFTIFAASAETDLSDSYVRLRLTVVKRVAERDDETVFTGELELNVAADGAAAVSAAGAFPTNHLVLTDLSLTSVHFDVFHVLVLPNLTIDYTFRTVPNEDFTLEATLEVSTANVPGGAGAAAVLGTPTDSLTQVIDLTLDRRSSSDFVSKLNSERANPTGKAAFTEHDLSPLLPACGLLGFEMLVGMAALVGMKSRPIFRGRK